MDRFFLLAVIICIAYVTKLQAYPQFIAHGYNTCMTCHFNPLGGGPLNDYGRALGSNTISARLLVPKRISEDKLAEYSGFFFKESKSALKPHANYRGISVTQNFTKENSEKEYISMEAKIGATIQLGKRKQYISSATISYVPTTGDTTGEEKNYRSREHYIGYRSEKKWGLYFGLLDKAFGLRIPDHTAYAKGATALAQNDQSHGALFNMLKDKWNLNLHLFMGNMTQDAELRQVGASARYEYNFSKDSVVGASFLTSSSDFLKQSNYALHSKLSLGKGTSLMTELGMGSKASKINTNDDSLLYLFSQHHIRIQRGLYYFTTLEYLKADSIENSKILRFGPGIQYFPIQKIELRAEIVNTRVLSEDQVGTDGWQFFGQVHIWL